MLQLKYVAKTNRKCHRCGNKILAGEHIAKFRERALTSHEACHAGTMYPFRSVCKTCVEKETV